MVWWIAAAQGALSIAGGLQSQKRAQQATRANVELIRAETAEELRRTRREFDFVFGQQQAVIGGAGVTFSGTPALQQQALQREQGLQLQWIGRAGQLRVEAARRSGQYIGKQQFASGLASGISSFGQAYGQYSQQSQAQESDTLGGFL